MKRMTIIVQQIIHRNIFYYFFHLILLFYLLFAKIYFKTSLNTKINLYYTSSQQIIILSLRIYSILFLRQLLICNISYFQLLVDFMYLIHTNISISKRDFLLISYLVVFFNKAACRRVVFFFFYLMYRNQSFIIIQLEGKLIKKNCYISYFRQQKQQTLQFSCLLFQCSQCKENNP